MAKAKGKIASKKSSKATRAAAAKPKAKQATKPAKTAKAAPQAKAKAKARPAKAAPKAAPKPQPKAKAKATPKSAKAAPKAKPKARPASAPAQNGATGGIAHAELARKGNLDALFGVMDMESGSKNDRLAYKWLNAASDFGHEEADDLIGDVMEVSSLRYDDDAFETAAAHWELATAYLEGTDGLPLDLGLARKHLEEAFRTHDLDAINTGTKEDYSAEPLLARLTGEARSLLEAAIAGGLAGGAAGDHDVGDENDRPVADDEEGGVVVIGGAGATPVAEADEEDFVAGEGDEDDDDEDDDGA